MSTLLEYLNAIPRSTFNSLVQHCIEYTENFTIARGTYLEYLVLKFYGETQSVDLILVLTRAVFQLAAVYYLEAVKVYHL